MAALVNTISLPDLSFSQDHKEDLEVEGILNDIGFFADGILEDSIVTSDMDFMTPSVVPMSPEHHYVFPKSHEISPSSSAENLESFSVPNPMAIAPVPNPIASVSPSGLAPPPPIIPSTAHVHLPKVPVVTPKKTAAKKDTKNRKRKLAAAPPVVPTKPASTFGDDGDLTEEQLEERRQRNREHAKRSRQRKKSLTSTLQQSVDELKAENAKLRAQLYASLGQSNTMRALKARQERERRSFLQGLQQPQNRVVDDATRTFLKSLRKNVTTAAAVKKRRINSN